MKIKGSLLTSVPTVERFWPKIFPSPLFGPNFDIFGRKEGLNINLIILTPHWLIGKRVVDFLLVLFKLFSLSVMADVLRVKIDRKAALLLQRGTKFQAGGVTPPIIFAWIDRPMNALQLCC